MGLNLKNGREDGDSKEIYFLSLCQFLELS